MIITIDGPSASGKSSVAQKLAQQLNFIHINSGFLYRAAAVIFLKQAPNYFQNNSKNNNPANQPEFLQLLSQLKYIYNPATNRAQVYYLDQDLTPELKIAQVSQMASVLSANSEIREIINKLQRDLVIAQPESNYIADGRDCGSVVFPQANLKIFLTASIQVRAERFCRDLLRQQQAKQKAQQAPLQSDSSQLDKSQLAPIDCLAELTERDQRDLTRTVAPLIVPAGAVIIDSSALTLEQVVQKIKQLIA